ncbi:MAG: DUF6708 domain-containing protein [Pseudomonadota bacterium]
MDVTDQPHLTRQWAATAAFVVVLGVILMLWSSCFMFFYLPENLKIELIPGYLIIFAALSGFLYFLFTFNREDIFSVKRRPIRFSRKEQRIFAIRRRRFFFDLSRGDVSWEAPWSESSIFCIHRGTGANSDQYHIRHYTIDDNGNVLRAFAIGREWEGHAALQGLLSQWNYWCAYMNDGPADLPKPALFLSEKESILESFLYCMYDFGYQASSAFRIAMMPAILLLTTFRVLALWTCRDPVWPKEVEAASAIEPDDPYDEPRGNTPVGWAKTGLARDQHTYPFDPKKAMPNWHGEPDPAYNAKLWSQDVPPASAAQPQRRLP